MVRVTERETGVFLAECVKSAAAQLATLQCEVIGAISDNAFNWQAGIRQACTTQKIEQLNCFAHYGNLLLGELAFFFLKRGGFLVSLPLPGPHYWTMLPLSRP
eukprot:TRINITY_DN14579_c0_g1_i1.p1 TRINITY_DN14579_c0_g1~~TRINITY_DN14579_c0_g1_i1.p1  ORF type:complete len:103 (-),score=13.05 TRINITY_DN14579_c0_g1_i1:297-605(-)